MAFLGALADGLAQLVLVPVVFEYSPAVIAQRLE